jgi:hypothetical protein
LRSLTIRSSEWVNFYFQWYCSCNNHMWHCSKQKKKPGVEHNTTALPASASQEAGGT